MSRQPSKARPGKGALGPSSLAPSPQHLRALLVCPCPGSRVASSWHRPLLGAWDPTSSQKLSYASSSAPDCPSSRPDRCLKPRSAHGNRSRHQQSPANSTVSYFICKRPSRGKGLHPTPPRADCPHTLPCPSSVPLPGSLMPPSCETKGCVCSRPTSRTWITVAG